MPCVLTCLGTAWKNFLSKTSLEKLRGNLLTFNLVSAHLFQEYHIILDYTIYI